MRNARQSFDAGLLARIEAGSMPEPNSGCWLWLQAHYSTVGYGQLKVRGRREGAHRAAWAAVHGPIPRGMCVCHKCDVRLCVNPDHLFLGTRADNNRDKMAKGRNRFPYGERATGAKLKDRDVLDIRKMRGAASAEEIAARFGVHPNTIRGIYSGRRWGRV